MNPAEFNKRLVAMVATDSATLDKFKEEAKTNGVDFYSLVCAHVLGRGVSEVTRQQRDAAKYLLFGYVYGCSTDKLKAMFKD